VQVTPLEACARLVRAETSIGAGGFDVKEIGGAASNARFSYLVDGRASRLRRTRADPPCLDRRAHPDRQAASNPEQRIALRAAWGGRETL
jgi:hypothetical protein